MKVFRSLKGCPPSRTCHSTTWSVNHGLRTNIRTNAHRKDDISWLDRYKARAVEDGAFLCTPEFDGKSNKKLAGAVVQEGDPGV